jgi:hypothetical protein
MGESILGSSSGINLSLSNLLEALLSSVKGYDSFGSLG